MKKFFSLFVALIAISFVVGSCGNKYGNPVDIQDLKVYTDTETNFSVKYPSNWVMKSNPGTRMSCYSTTEAQKRFGTYDPEGIPGARVEVYVIELDSVNTLEKIIDGRKKFDENIYKKENATIDGKQGVKLSYSFELNDGVFAGEMYFAQKDEKTATVLIMEAFGGGWDKYKDQFAQIVSSLKLAEIKEVAATTADAPKAEEPPASETMTLKTGPGYSIQIPDNFSSTRGTAKNAISSLQYIGKRRADCMIQVDVVDASKTKDLKKIVDENSAAFKNASAASKTSLSGADAYLVNYKPTANVKGRTIFALKNAKLYKITIYWFVGEEASYLPVFEKSIKSMKID